MVVETALWDICGPMTDAVETDCVETAGVEKTGPGKAGAVVEDRDRLTGAAVTERTSVRSEEVENAGVGSEVVPKKSIS